MKDFEDAIQVSAAELAEVEYLVTRNTKDFASASLRIYDPESFLEIDEQFDERRSVESATTNARGAYSIINTIT